MAGKPVRKMSRDERLALENKLFQAAAKEQDVARQKVRANMLRLRALRLAKEAEEAETAKPKSSPPGKDKRRQQP